MAEEREARVRAVTAADRDAAWEPEEPEVELPREVRQRVESLGPEGARWLSELPVVVAELARRWAFAVAGAPLEGGSAGLVVPVRLAGGGDAVLKVAVPSGAVGAQIATLAAAGGRGYVRLLARDVGRGAMLQERLGSSMDELGLPPEEMIVALCATLEQAWRLPSDVVSGPRPDKAAELGGLVGRLWESLGRPCSGRVARRALEFAARRAAASGRLVVVHGDPHPGNALRVPVAREGAESGFVFVDPDGFVADPAYDLGVVLREWCPQLLEAGDPVALARRYCGLLASSCGVREDAVWEWGFLERVSSGLYCLELGLEEVGRDLLATAEPLAGG